MRLIDLWGKVDVQFRGLTMGLACCDFDAAPLQTHLDQWKVLEEKCHVYKLIDNFLRNAESLPASQDAPLYINQCGLPQLLQLSSNDVLIKILTDPEYCNNLKSINLLTHRVNEIQALGAALKNRVAQELRAILKTPGTIKNTQQLTHYLIVMDNIRMVEEIKVKEWLMESCLERIDECKNLEDCLKVMGPFCGTVLNASAISAYASAYLTGRCVSLCLLRREVWKELAVYLSRSVKTVLESQSSSSQAVNSMVEFESGLNRISMAKDLECTVNMMAGGSEKTPRVQLKLRGTTSKLNAFITNRLIKHYRILLPTLIPWNSLNTAQDVEKALTKHSDSEQQIHKADAIEAVDLLNGFILLIDNVPYEIPDLLETVLLWLQIIHTLNSSKCPEYSSAHLINNVIKMSRHSSQMLQKISQ